MARSMSPAREKEYAELAAFIEFFATVVNGIPPTSPIHPSNVAIGIVEQFGRSKALQGARQAVNDIVEEFRGQPANAIKCLDDALLTHGLLTFSKASLRHGRTFQRILKRGKLASETEFYLVHAVLVDQAAEIDEAERNELARLVDEFDKNLQARGR